MGLRLRESENAAPVVLKRIICEMLMSYYGWAVIL